VRPQSGHATSSSTPQPATRTRRTIKATFAAHPRHS
jgi:hypothetical protein